MRNCGIIFIIKLPSARQLYFLQNHIKNPPDKFQVDFYLVKFAGKIFIFYIGATQFRIPNSAFRIHLMHLEQGV